MPQAYTPGLKVTPRTLYRARRVLPVSGETLIKQGERVGAEQVVAQTQMPGDVQPINLAQQLSIPPAEVPGALLKKEGEAVAAGELLARTKGLFGWFQAEYKSPYAGTVETISKLTGQVILRGPAIPVQVRAYLSGQVVEVLPKEGCVIEAEVCQVQGIFGIGGEAFGPVRMIATKPDQLVTPELIRHEHKGGVLIGGGRITAPAVARAVEVGAAALISGGIDDRDLLDILGYDLGVAVTGNETVGVTLIITEGFGDIAMARRTFELLKGFEGQAAAANGTTQIRAGVVRPEIIVPLVNSQATLREKSDRPEGALTPGAHVRLIRDPYFGLLGTVESLPEEPQQLASGSKARVLTVKLEDGKIVTTPRANIELVEE